MYKLKICAFFSFIFPLAVWSSATPAQVNGLDVDAPENAKIIRRQYRNSDSLPDGLAFMSLANHIATIYSTDSDAAIDLVSFNTGLDSGAARVLIAKIVESVDSFQEKLAISMKDIGCNENTPKALGDANFQLLATMDDEKDTISQQHYDSFKITLDSKTSRKLAKWIRDSKKRITHITFDHKELALKSGMANIDQRMYAICGNSE